MRYYLGLDNGGTRLSVEMIPFLTGRSSFPQRYNPFPWPHTATQTISSPVIPAFSTAFRITSQLASHILGLDNGGTSTKAAVFDETGREVAVAGMDTAMLVPKIMENSRAVFQCLFSVHIHTKHGCFLKNMAGYKIETVGYHIYDRYPGLESLGICHDEWL